MCLKINYNIKASRVNKDGYCVGYKVVEVEQDGLKSYYKGFKYCIGDFVSNRKSAQLEYNEVYEINLGFHLFTTRNEARRFKTGKFATRMIRVFYKPEDAVAYGFFLNRGCYESVVVHKMTISSLKAIR